MFSDVFGLPKRFMIPALLAGASLFLALLGMYWDIGVHIDDGRDGALITPAHTAIVLGLQGVLVSAVLHGVMRGPRAPGERRVGPLSLSPGSLQLLACSTVALSGFPLDALWHELFGEDVTLWGPTHLFLVGGGALSTLGAWTLLREAKALGTPRGPAKHGEWLLAGGLLTALTSFTAEFDYGVPQFQLLFHPVLLALAAGFALVAARLLLGPGGALKAVAFYLALRLGLSAFVGPGLGHTLPAFPLHVAAAVAVELAALAAARSRWFPLVAGAGIGTAGLAAEWGWTHVGHDLPWTASLLPEAVPLALAAAVGGALLGTRAAQALGAPAPADPLPLRAVLAGGAAVLVALAVPLPRGDGDGTRAAVVPTPAGPGQVRVEVRLDPPAAARGAEWFAVLSWQGREPSRHVALREVAPGRFVSAEPVPTGGNWKTMVRLARGDELLGLPVFLAAAPWVGEPAVPAVARSGVLGADTALLQREARGGPTWLEALAYGVCLLLAAGWVALTALALRRAERRGAELPSRALVPA
jgi:hypothetical protein